MRGAASRRGTALSASRATAVMVALPQPPKEGNIHGVSVLVIDDLAALGIVLAAPFVRESFVREYYVNTHVPSRFTAVEDHAWAIRTSIYSKRSGMRERARVGQGGTPIRSRSTFAVLHGGSARSGVPGRGRAGQVAGGLRTNRKTQVPARPSSAHRRAGRIAEDLDDGRRARSGAAECRRVGRCAARRGGRGVAVGGKLVAHTRDSPVERPSRALEPRGRTQRPRIVVFQRDVRRVRDDDPRTDADPD